MTVYMASLVLLTPLMALTGYYDLKEMRIPNWLSGLVLAAFVVIAAIYLPLGEIGMRVLIALIIFAVCVGVFSIGHMGGGDVKMFPAAALFVPSSDLLGLGVMFSILQLVECGALFGLRRLAPADVGWVALQRGKGFPKGIAIASAMLIYLSIKAF